MKGGRGEGVDSPYAPWILILVTNTENRVCGEIIGNWAFLHHSLGSCVAVGISYFLKFCDSSLWVGYKPSLEIQYPVYLLYVDSVQGSRDGPNKRHFAV